MLNGYDIPPASAANVCNTGCTGERNGCTVADDAECQASCDACATCDAWITNTPEASSGSVTCWLVRSEDAIESEVDTTRNMGIAQCGTYYIHWQGWGDL